MGRSQSTSNDDGIGGGLIVLIVSLISWGITSIGLAIGSAKSTEKGENQCNKKHDQPRSPINSNDNDD